MTEWHYEKEGRRHGPLTEKEITTLITQRHIHANTLVWHQGQITWMPLNTTLLAAALPATSEHEPPPIPNYRLNNTVVWFLAFAPLLGFMLESVIAILIYGRRGLGYSLYQLLFTHPFWYLSVILNIALSYHDEHSLKKAGIDTDGYGAMAWLVPVYLWRRAKALGQTPSYFWVWVILFGIIMLGTI